jgi:hypothetical protein
MPDRVKYTGELKNWLYYSTKQKKNPPIISWVSFAELKKKYAKDHLKKPT